MTGGASSTFSFGRKFDAVHLLRSHAALGSKQMPSAWDVHTGHTSVALRGSTWYWSVCEKKGGGGDVPRTGATV